jgi:hypothetical protein
MSSPEVVMSQAYQRVALAARAFANPNDRFWHDSDLVRCPLEVIFALAPLQRPKTSIPSLIGC